MATLSQPSLSVPLFQYHLFTSCLSFPFGTSPSISNFSIIIIYIMVICDRLSLILLLQKIISCWRYRWLAFFRNKYFKIKMSTLIFKQSVIAHISQHSVNITFMCTGKQVLKNDMIFYCWRNTSFIAVLWQWTLKIPMVFVHLCLFPG